MTEKEILQYLYDNLYDKHVNLLDYLIEKYPTADRSLLLIIQSTLETLYSKKEFITISNDDFRSLGMRDSRGVITLQRLKEQTKSPLFQDGILARITYDGIQEIEKHVFSNQIKQVNQSVIKTNFWLPFLTGALVIVSVIGSLREILKDRQQSSTEQLLKRQIIISDSLSKILQKTDSSLHLKDSSRIKNTKKVKIA